MRAAVCTALGDPSMLALQDAAPPPMAARGVRIRVRVSDRVMAYVTAGAFAEEVVTLESRVHRIPPIMDFTTAASFPFVYGTSYFGLADRARIAPDGRIFVVGFASGQAPPIPANILLVKNLSVIGLHWGAYLDIRPEDFARQFEVLFKWWEEGALKPHTSHIFPLERVQEAFAALIERRSSGKVALSVGEP